jgi:hypothetical protein
MCRAARIWRLTGLVWLQHGLWNRIVELGRVVELKLPMALLVVAIGWGTLYSGGLQMP